MVKEINNILEKYHIQAVGDGLIDLICPMEHVDAFVSEISRLNIEIKGFTWWCQVTEGHKPCGMGGPQNKYGLGWFSEIPMKNIIRFENNEEYVNFLIHKWPVSSEYKECYRPGFYLE